MNIFKRVSDFFDRAVVKPVEKATDETVKVVAEPFKASQDSSWDHVPDGPERDGCGG